MATPQITFVNIVTGETVTRDMDETELAQYEKDKTETKAKREAEAKQAKLKTETLTKLGLTADEVAALLS